jgi:hypothetical protein
MTRRRTRVRFPPPPPIRRPDLATCQVRANLGDEPRSAPTPLRCTGSWSGPGESFPARPCATRGGRAPRTPSLAASPGPRPEAGLWRHGTTASATSARGHGVRRRNAPAPPWPEGSRSPGTAREGLAGPAGFGSLWPPVQPAGQPGARSADRYSPNTGASTAAGTENTNRPPGRSKRRQVASTSGAYPTN